MSDGYDWGSYTDDSGNFDWGGGDTSWWDDYFTDDSGGVDYSALTDDNASWWDTQDNWDQSYDDLFGEQDTFQMSPDIWDDITLEANLYQDSKVAKEDPWYKKLWDNKNAMGLIGALGIKGAQMLGKKSQAEAARANREREMAFQEKLLKMKQDHDMRMAEFAASHQRQRSSGGGGGRYIPSAGKADKTNTALANKKVVWGK